MRRKRLANSVRKYIRDEKARIRRQASDIQEAEEKIKELVVGIMGARVKLTAPEK